MIAFTTISPAERKANLNGPMEKMVYPKGMTLEMSPVVA
jgi:hypothetical protein